MFALHWMTQIVSANSNDTGLVNLIIIMWSVRPIV